MPHALAEQWARAVRASRAELHRWRADDDAGVTSPSWSGPRPRCRCPVTWSPARPRPARSAARTAGLAGASVLPLLGGMAANDWADRELDAVERPERPIPSGRVAPAGARASRPG